MWPSYDGYITITDYRDIIEISRKGYITIQITERSQEITERLRKNHKKSHNGHITVTNYRLQITDHRIITANYYSYFLFDFISYYIINYVIIKSIFYYNNRKNLLKNQNLIRLSTNFNLKNN